MTQQEASEHYGIPVSVLQEYESWGLCGAVKKVFGAWQYDGEDLERLSTVMTLHDIGFTAEESETYMRLLLEQPDSEVKRLRMLEEKRRETLGYRGVQLQKAGSGQHSLRLPGKAHGEPDSAPHQQYR